MKNERSTIMEEQIRIVKDCIDNGVYYNKTTLIGSMQANDPAILPSVPARYSDIFRLHMDILQQSGRLA